MAKEETKLEEVMSEETPTEEELSTKEKADREAFAAAQEKERKATGAPKEEETSEEQVEDDGDDASEETPESKKAREFLRLKTQAPKETIDNLSPAEAVEWRKAMQEREATVDRTFSEASELRQQIAELREQLESKETTTESEPSRAVPTGEVDLSQTTARLEEQFGKEEAKALTDVLNSLVKPLQDRISQQEQIIQQDREQSGKDILRKNRERLGERIPILKESDEAWKAFQGSLATEVNENGKSYARYEDIFDHVAKALYGEDALADSPLEEAEDTSDRATAKPTPPKQKPKPRRLSAQEKQKAAFDYLQKNPGDIRGARRAQGLRA